MDEPVWSSEALNELDEYFDNSIIVYVEGDTDRVFYSTILKTINVPNWHILEAGGKNEVRKYASDLVAGNLDIIILTDMDYAQYFDDGISDHVRIVRTQGHSIENMLLSPRVVGRIVELKSRSFDDFSQEFAEWRSNNFGLLKKLIVVDIENQRQGLGKVILDKNYDQYTLTKNSCHLSHDKIEGKTIELMNTMALNEEILGSTELVGDISKVVRGHFYQKGVRSYVLWKSNSISGRKVSLSDDDIFDLAISIIRSDISLIEDIDDFTNRVLAAFESISRNPAA